MGSINVVLTRLKYVKERFESYERTIKSFPPAPPEDDPEYKDWLDSYIEFIKSEEKALWRYIYGNMLGSESYWNVPSTGLDFLYSDVEVGRIYWGFGWAENFLKGGTITEEEYHKYKHLDKPISLVRALGYDSFFFEITKIPVEKRFMYICVGPLGACVDGVYYDLGSYWIDVCNKDMVEIVGGLYYKFTDVYPINIKLDTWPQIRMIGEIIKDVQKSDA